MSFTVTTDEEVFRRFWLDEKENSPRYLADATDAWHTSFEEFLDFCSKHHTFLVNDNILVYVDHTGNTHISILRDSDKTYLLDDFIGIRNRLFKTHDVLYAWVGTHNPRLQKMVEAIGFQYHGLNMYHGFSRNHLFEWHCYILRRADFFTLKNVDSLITSA